MLRGSFEVIWLRRSADIYCKTRDVVVVEAAFTILVCEHNPPQGRVIKDNSSIGGQKNNYKLIIIIIVIRGYYAVFSL